MYYMKVRLESMHISDQNNNHKRCYEQILLIKNIGFKVIFQNKSALFLGVILN